MDTTVLSDTKKPANFIRSIIEEDIRQGKHEGRIHTRFPPEPNGYLHIGHAKAICTDFGMAEDYDGLCNLRFDDTNPVKEETHYAEAIMEDIRWLGFDWGDRLYHASDYFETLYDYALKLIRKGKAFVCDLTADEMREYRGTLKDPGKNSPYRDRTIDENLDLFQKMRAGEYPDGAKVLRARIDMSHGNLNMRDPVMYRIKHAHHHRTGDKWCIYPTYDFTHGQSDSIEGVTHSLCTIEFEDHRPLYEWYIRELDIFPSRQIEFAPLVISYTMFSKRRLRQMVEEGYVDGWDDPRMPTLRGIRRRGFTAASLRDLVNRVGMAKRESVTDIALMDHCLREELNKTADRRMAVLKPLKVVITNYPEGQTEELEAVNNPEQPEAGTRMVPFSRELYIEQDDFMEDPPKKFFRLGPGREVRLRYAYWMKCEEVVKDDAGNIVELRCTYDPLTKGGNAPPDGRKVKATLHWVDANSAVDAEVRLFDRMFVKENPNDVEEGQTWLDNLNPNALETLTGCKLERSLSGSDIGYQCQFERMGYFITDTDSSADKLIFNRSVTLKDTWAKMQGKG